MDGNQTGQSSDGRAQASLDWRLALLVSALALAVAAAHAMWPDMTIDSVTLGLLAFFMPGQHQGEFS